MVTSLFEGSSLPCMVCQHSWVGLASLWVCHFSLFSSFIFFNPFGKTQWVFTGKGEFYGYLRCCFFHNMKLARS
uniref:Uncharacterized protein n=1 Tax=Glycine max TaxID=3847 RepID=C6TM02_SOYBN|nr:unknown [Glycine max]